MFLLPTKKKKIVKAFKAFQNNTVRDGEFLTKTNIVYEK